LVRGKRLRDTPWGDPLLTPVEQQREVYEAPDRALDELKADAQHRTAVWRYAVLRCATYYAWLRGEYIGRRVKTLSTSMDGDLWRWLEACSDEQRREFRDQYTAKFGAPRFKRLRVRARKPAAAAASPKKKTRKPTAAKKAAQRPRGSKRDDNDDDDGGGGGGGGGNKEKKKRKKTQKASASAVSGADVGAETEQKTEGEEEEEW